MNTKPKWLQNNKRVIEFEPECDGISVVAAYGWAFEPSDDAGNALHTRVYRNTKEARSGLRRIAPCSCLRCTSLGTLA